MDTRSTMKPRRRLRAKLTLHGLSYKAFAAQHGFNARTVKAAVRNERAGAISKKIAAAINSL